MPKILNEETIVRDLISLPFIIPHPPPDLSFLMMTLRKGNLEEITMNKNGYRLTNINHVHMKRSLESLISLTLSTVPGT